MAIRDHLLSYSLTLLMFSFSLAQPQVAPYLATKTGQPSSISAAGVRQITGNLPKPTVPAGHVLVSPFDKIYPQPLFPGDIIVFKADYVSKVSTATLSEDIMTEDSYDSNGSLRKIFVRFFSSLTVSNPPAAVYIGFLVIERPIPDPDTRFESLAHDPLLSRIPSGLRALADPNLLIPAPTEGCASTKCFVIIPVSSHFSEHFSS